MSESIDVMRSFGHNKDNVDNVQMCPNQGGSQWLYGQLDDWKTQAEAAEILKCSQKTVGRMAAQKKIQRVLRRVPGRKPMPVFNPDDIEAIRAEMVQVEPFPVKERGEVKSLTRQTSQGGIDLLAQLLADRISPDLVVPVEQKVFFESERSRRIQRTA